MSQATSWGAEVASALAEPPVLVMIAGPNGAGKSTFHDAYLAPLGLEFVNPDLIEAQLRTQARDADPSAYEAARLAATRREQLLAEAASFCMETVLSDPHGEKVELLRRARQAGYRIVLVFIGVEDPALLIGRVVQRVQAGGHDVPDEKILGRYPRALRNLASALPLAHHAFVFNNSSTSEPYRHVATYVDGVLAKRTSVQVSWFEPAR